MTSDQFLHLINDRITLTHAPFKTLVAAEVDVFMGHAVVAVEMRVKDRDNGTPRVVLYKNHVGRDAIADLDERDVVEMLFRFVSDAYAHEVAEALLLDGVRVLDPHALDPWA